MSDNRLARALLLAIKVHADQRDKQGRPYLLHVSRVVWAVAPRARVLAAVHDVVEDSAETVESVSQICELTPKETKALDLLTRRDGEEYPDYIDRMARCALTMARTLAIEVKFADLRDNLARIPAQGDDKRWLWLPLKRRYTQAILQLDPGASA